MDLNETGEIRQCFNSSQILTMKGDTYFRTYERYFKEIRERIKDRKIKFLEIGIWNGGSIDMWYKYFGANIELYMVDINSDCLKLKKKFPNVNIYIGDQADKRFLLEIAEKGPFDIILDDGGHTMNQQNTSFRTLFEHVSPGGIYICEDLHTSYWKSFGGGYLKSDSFIETSKSCIDKINAYQSEDSKLTPDYITKNCSGIYCVPSMCIFEKSFKEQKKLTDIVAGYETLK